MSKISQYLKDTKIELKHVVWLTKNQVIFYTVIVIILSILVAYFLGFFDSLFSRGLEKIISY
ncbi:MAG: preprotein translocase subunit SecE [Patescibacteria group bacterium]